MGTEIWGDLCIVTGMIKLGSRLNPQRHSACLAHVHMRLLRRGVNILRAENTAKLSQRVFISLGAKETRPSIFIT